MATSTEYAIGVGHGLSSGSLTAVSAITQLRWQGRYYELFSRSVINFPQDIVMQDGSVRSDGILTHEWTFGIIPRAGLTHLITTYITVSSVAVKSAPVTIQTYNYDTAAWKRYNAYVIKPTPIEIYEDYFGAILNLRLQFSGLTEL